MDFMKRYDADGNSLVVSQPATGSEINFYAPNLCDPCSWYPGSLQVTNFALVDSGDLKTWNTGGLHVNWIDAAHGRIFKEDVLLAANPQYALVVEVLPSGGTVWVQKTENSWGVLDNDYTADYSMGSVTFNSALGVGDAVRASFCKAGSYVYYVEPGPGKWLKTIYAEVQYTEDLVMDQNVEFTLEVYNPADLPNRIPYRVESYKTMVDFYQESTGPFPVMPPHGGTFTIVEAVGVASIQSYRNQGYATLGTRHDGTNWIALLEKRNGSPRALTSPLLTVPFKYNAYRPLRSSIGARIKITLSGSGPLGGEFANVTFYCLSLDEAA